jgi:hypothetical protein
MWSLDVADTWCRVLQTLNFNVADVEFRCRGDVMLGFVSRRRGRRATNVECCTQHSSQHARNIVATWGRREEAHWCLDVARNMLATWLTIVSHFMLKIVVYMSHPCSSHVARVPCECFKIRSKIFYVANINFRCCRCWVSMLQTRVVGCCKH